MQDTHTHGFNSSSLIFFSALLLLISQAIFAQVVIKDTMVIAPQHLLRPNFIVPDPPPDPEPVPHDKFFVMSTLDGHPAVDFGLIPGSDETIRLKLHYSFTLGVLDVYNGEGFNFYMASRELGPYIFSRYVASNSLISVAGTVDIFDLYGGGSFSEGKFYFSFNPGIVANSISINDGGDTALFYYDVYEEGIKYFTGVAILSVVFPDTIFDHFKVTFERDTAAFTESAKIFVQAKDANDRDVELPADRLVRLSVTANDEYGTFIDKNGDTLKTTPVKVEHIPYGDAKAGLIQFSAVKKNPVDPVLCTVKVELESDPTKVGEKEIPVVEQTLKIVMEGERKVEPRNLLGRRTPPAPTNANKKEFAVQLTRNKAAVAGHSFVLTSDYIDGSGGHDHIATRRVRNRDNYGYFILKRTNTEHDSPYNGQTQEDGRERFEYVASVFGDRMLLRVETTEPNKKQFLWDTLSLAEKVEGLINFASITSDIWRLTGNTGTTSYRRCSGTVIHHPSNHYVTANTSTRLQAAIRDFAEWSGTERGGGHYLVLGINDMSLMYGGLFDICSDWAMPGHQSHRKGSSVDIDGSAKRYDGQGFVNLNALAPDGFTFLKHLTDIMRNHRGTKEPEEPIHYGF